MIRLCKFWGIYCLCIMLITGCFTACNSQQKNSLEVPLPYYNSPDFTPQWIEANDPEYDNIHTIAPFAFINQNGDSITQKHCENKIYVANFFFTTCPGICPKMTNNMGLLQEEFINDDNVLLLSHTVTPHIDSVAQLQNYAQVKRVNSQKWHLLTGNKTHLYTIARKSYFADMDIDFTKSVEDFLHTENFVLVDDKARIRGVYNGTLTIDMKRLTKDIYTLKQEMDLN